MFYAVHRITLRMCINSQGAHRVLTHQGGCYELTLASKISNSHLEINLSFIFKLNINANSKRVCKDNNASPPFSFLCGHFEDGVILSSCLTYLQT